MYCYNTSHHVALSTTPFKVLYGYNPPPIVRFGTQMTPVDSVDKMLQERDPYLDKIKQHLSKAQVGMKMRANKKRKEVQGLGLAEVGTLQIVDSGKMHERKIVTKKL